MRVGLPIYVDYFGNTNIHEWLDEERKEVVDNIHEEVLDDAETVDTVEIRHEIIIATLIFSKRIMVQVPRWVRM